MGVILNDPSSVAFAKEEVKNLALPHQGEGPPVVLADEESGL
jgi:hypothetical protein